jgi:tetratricopeptide (TPR) repeat protein
MSRFRNQPDAALLARAIDHVRSAIELERDLAEAHATLAFILISAGRAKDALASGRRAVALEPGYWGNQFRLAHAAWGEERLRALSRAMEMYPDFPFAHFEVAMVHIARGALDRADSVLREATIVQDRQANLRQRYPAKGLHWLLGFVRLALGDTAEARAEFDKEIAGAALQLYAREFTTNAFNGAGFLHLRTGEPAAAMTMFRRALDLFPEHARALVGLGTALTASGDQAGADAAFAQAANAIDGLRRGGRTSEACMAEAFLHTVCGRAEAAVEALRQSLERSELQFTGWTVPIEPLFEPLKSRPDFQEVLATIARRAR